MLIHTMYIPLTENYFNTTDLEDFISLPYIQKTAF